MTNSSRLTDYLLEHERSIISQVKEKVTTITRDPPKAWLGPVSPRLLIQRITSQLRDSNTSVIEGRTINGLIDHPALSTGDK